MATIRLNCRHFISGAQAQDQLDKYGEVKCYSCAYTTSTLDDQNVIENTPTPVPPVVAQEPKTKPSEKPLTRKECVTILAEAGYTGPVSYPMDKLRQIVSEVTS